MSLATIEKRLNRIEQLRQRHQTFKPFAPLPFGEYLVDKFLPQVAAFKQLDPEVYDPKPTHMLRWANMVEKNRFVGIVAFRNGLKSVLAKAAVAWDLHRFQRGHYEGYYFSSKLNQARKHVRELKLILAPIAKNEGWHDTTRGEAMLRYERKGALFELSPDGVDASARGSRADRLVLDDLLDPKKAISVADIDRVQDAVQRRLLPLLKRGDSRVIYVGTPILENDLTDWITQNREFTTEWLPILNEKNESNWPTMYSKEAIEQLRRTVGDKSFRIEYQLERRNVTNSYIDPEILKRAFGK